MPILAFLAFGESFILPIPPDALLAPMILARPASAWRAAIVCSIASVVGGLVGYYIGYGLHPVAHWILIKTGHAGAELPIQAAYAKYGIGVILASVVPIMPFPIITLSSGLAHLSLWQFTAAIAVARTGRFFAVAALIKHLGPAVVHMLSRRLGLVVLSAFALVVVAVTAVYFLKLGLG